MLLLAPGRLPSWAARERRVVGLLVVWVDVVGAWQGRDFAALLLLLLLSGPRRRFGRRAVGANAHG